ncbi:hypothetical protein BCR39DRAFT_502346 [Naematelia encephala]|uniref:HTH psq-type domain-containing protein n=1 Tax=Naematelia encephala TaxID=71784 RepID=A0A1Y2AEG3_9TREE|nr:hypothetical protein BCR39DRAFT_502346 [Naematelia encephala]
MNMGANGDWTAEKRELIMDRIIANGYKATDISELATEYGVSISNMSHAIQAGRKGNFRDKAIKAVVGEEAT